MADDRRYSIVELAAEEQTEFSRTTELASLWSLVESISASYDQIGDAIETVAMSPEPKNKTKARQRAVRSIVGNLFVRAAGRSCQMDFLDLARRHFPEAISNRRRALECIGFAWIAWRLPADSEKVVDAWLHGSRAPRGSAAWDEYDKSFNNARVKAALVELNPDLKRVHDEFSSRSHPGIKGLVHSISRQASAATRSLDRVGAFDGYTLERAGLVPEMKAEWFLDASRFHVRLLEAFTRKAFRVPQWTVPRDRSAAILTELRSLVIREEQAAASGKAALDAHRAAASHAIRERKGTT